MGEEAKQDTLVLVATRLAERAYLSGTHHRKVTESEDLPRLFHPARPKSAGYCTALLKTVAVYPCNSQRDTKLYWRSFGAMVDIG